MSEPSVEQQLATISRAWGKQSGYAFFPTISGKATSRQERIQSYREHRAFMWPKEKPAILDHMAANETNDLYWCPSLFERKVRQMEFAMDEHCLWADLDEVDPKEIKDYPPTIAWETSPKRYQALWLVSGGDVQGSSWQGGENQRLTYYLGADLGGWDTTQLLRIPGWRNHKPAYKEANKGKAAQGKILWTSGRRYLPDDFEDLPEVQSVGEITTILEDQVESVDHREVWGRVRLRLPHRARELFAAKQSVGDRSEQLWWMMRCLADVGCSVPEIVALVRTTVWNKFAGRHDELKRLTIEASKAIAQRSEETSDALEEERSEERPDPTNLFDLVENVPQPEWIVNEVISVGACGFIAGEPKTYKSWVALDLCLSVATGIPFLDHFGVRRPGPVLYLQEEDSAPQIKSRLGKIWPGKQADKMLMQGGELVWVPPDPKDKPRINALVRGGITISDPAWQAWLDEVMEKGYDGEPYIMVLIDPLMMVAGDVEENRSQEMTTKIFRPLKVLAEKHTCAVMIVHHMKKGTDGRGRGGQALLGSVANHAWAEDSLYLRMSQGGVVSVERESKHATTGRFKISRLRNSGWTPVVSDDKLSADDEGSTPNGVVRNGRSNGRSPKIWKALDELGPGEWSTKQVADQMGVTTSGAYRQLIKAEGAGKIKKTGNSWVLAE